MNTKIHLSIIFSFITSLSLTSSLFAYEGDIPVQISEGSPFYCLANAEYGNGLAKFDGTRLAEIGLNNKIGRLLNLIRNITREIVAAREDGNSTLVLRLKSNRIKKKNLRNILIECQNQSGIFDPLAATPDVPTQPETPIDPDTGETACSIIGNNNSLNLKLYRSFPKIINGSACVVGNSPTVELELFVAGRNDGFCTGTVVNPTTVITAAHCAQGISSIKIYYGSGVITSSSIHVHPDYESTNDLQDHDVAVIRTSSEIPTRTVNILSGNNLTVNELGFIGGYGLSNGSNNNSSGTLRAATVLLDTVAGNSIGTVYTAGNTHGNTCSGDSGGPLLVKRNGSWVLAGVTSNGVSRFCTPTDFSYYANLTSTSNRNFINGIVPNLIN